MDAATASMTPLECRSPATALVAFCSRGRRRVNVNGWYMSISKITRDRLRKVKRAFTTRRIPIGKMRTLISGSEKPRAGDLVMAMIVEIGSHRSEEHTSEIQ